MIPETIFKQYVALATKWKGDLLLRARIKLTVAYVGFSALLLSVFSYILYGALESKILDSLDDQSFDPALRMVFFDRATDALQAQIILADGVALFLVLIFGYVLTAFTLKPIAQARERERRFLADSAHELRMPLAVMKTGTEVALRVHKELPPSVKKLLTENIDEIDALTKIANGLLSLLGGQKSSVSPHSVVSLQTLLQETLQKLAPIAQVRGITLQSLEVHTKESVTLQGSKNALASAFENVIENALKYTLEGGTVTVALTREGESLQVQIVDTGIGIANEDLSRITEPFFRADTARTAQSGSGLGLSIVSEIVHAHDGTLSIESRIGVGTTVQIMLPAVSS